MTLTTTVSTAYDEDAFDPWWREAICAEIGESLFFSNVGQSVDEAKAACAICPVRLQCLTDALASDSQYGVFGGFSRTQRDPMRHRVQAGADPREVAEEAIAKDKKRKHP